MEGFIILIITVLLGGVIECIYVPMDLDRKIHEEISQINGEVLKIKRLTDLERIYVVEYRLNEEIIRKNVKYHMFMDIEWI